MTTMLGTLRIAALLFVMAAVGACDTAEERAEQHYQKGRELLEEGDVDRALVELRNVFKLNGQHRDARALYAETVRDRGNANEAFSQYLRLVEQYPEDLEGRQALAEIAIESRNWEQAREHGQVAVELAPEAKESRVIQAVLDYQAAVADEDTGARREALDVARALEEENPDNTLLDQVVIDGLLRENDDVAALQELDEALATDPDDRLLYRLRLQILARRDDTEAIEAQLREMVQRFPDDDQIAGTMIRFFMSQDDLESAESFLRQRIDESAEDVAGDRRMALVQFLQTTHGPQAAREELDRIIEEVANGDRFRAVRATIDYQTGRRQQAISDLEDLLADAEESEQTREIKVIQAQFLRGVDNEVGARKLVEEVLAEDSTMVAALRMKAAWLIDSDQADEAINVLRSALDQDPNDADTMTLMAQAHLRAGSRDLAGEVLSRAVEASGSAPAESLRYAQFLTSSERMLPAESILIAALRLAPNNVELLAELGQIYVAIEDWPRAGQIESRLREIGTEPAVALADSLRLNSLQGRERDEDATAFLEDLAGQEGKETAARVAMVRSHLGQGDVEAARDLLDEMLEQEPSNPVHRFLDAAVEGAAGDLEAAIAGYRDLLEDQPKSERVWVELIRTLNRAGKPEEAGVALEAALEEIPDGRDLLWNRASRLEQSGDIEGAIEIYQRLYSEDSGASVVANNLASLLSSHRDDEESLAQAYAIARRLRSSEFPPFQDTYGWIAYLRGDYEEALRHLEPAAEGLPQDPSVQYHLGMTYAALERVGEAEARLRKAIEIAGDSRPDLVETAEQALGDLQTGQ